MNNKKENRILKQYLENFQERIQQPQLKNLRQITNFKKRKINLKKQLKEIGLSKKRAKKIIKEEQQHKYLNKHLRRKNCDPLPKYIASVIDDCRRFREEIHLRGNAFIGMPITEGKSIFHHQLTTQNPKTLKCLPKIKTIVDSQKKQTSKNTQGWSPEGPFQAYLKTENHWFRDNEEQTILTSYYDVFFPKHSKYTFFIKWDGKGWYNVIAQYLEGYPEYPGRVKLKIKLRTHISQFIRSEQGNIEVIVNRMIPWTILDIDSSNINSNNYIGGFELFEKSISLYPNQYTYITQEMDLYAYSTNYAGVILDFLGSESERFWIDFGVFIIPDYRS